MLKVRRLMNKKILSCYLSMQGTYSDVNFPLSLCIRFTRILLIYYVQFIYRFMLHLYYFILNQPLLMKPTFLAYMKSRWWTRLLFGIWVEFDLYFNLSLWFFLQCLQCVLNSFFNVCHKSFVLQACVSNLLTFWFLKKSKLSWKK